MAIKKKSVSISKSRYMSGLQCPKKMWLAIHKKEISEKPDINLQFIFDEGHKVGEFAREWRGKGTLIELDWNNSDKAFEETNTALNKGTKRIYEAGFQKNGFRAFVDIIEKKKDGTWRVIEVKSTARPKEAHIPDLAFQCWLMEENGLKVSEAGVVHLNKQGIWPDKKSILTYTELTEKIKAELKNSPKNAKRLIKVAQITEEPDIEPGEQCYAPYQCDYLEYCGVSENNCSLNYLPRLGQGQRTELANKGWEELKDIPAKNNILNSTQQKWLKAYASKKPYIDKEYITDWFKQLRYPLYSFDFETIAYGLPRYDGISPFQKIPFQFSCHKQNKGGEIKKSGFYLHKDKSDPRLQVIKAMIKCLGKRGSIIAWNASFERGVMKDLAKEFPEYSSELIAFTERLIDPIPIFRNAYFHPKAQGSASLKMVGNALLPDADYSKMEVGDGSTAFVTWHNWINGQSTETTEQALLDYCNQDTLIPLNLLKIIEP